MRNELFEIKDIPQELRQYFKEVEVQCRSPWERVVEPLGKYAEALQKPTWKSGGLEKGHAKPAGFDRLSKETRTTGCRPTCTHNLAPVPCTVLDPFSGAGTTGMVAEKLGRKYIGIELNPEYSEMGEKRIEAARLPLFR